MSEILSVTTTVSGGRHVVTPHGELDVATAPPLKAHLQPLLEGQAEIVMDLSELSFMDSSGIALLVATARAAADLGARLEVRDPSPPVLRVLELCGVAQQLLAAPESRSYR
jgi:anti-anti-sigma factor